MDPMGCGPLGGSVTTVTEYTGSVNKLCKLYYHSLSVMSRVLLVDTRLRCNSF